MADAGKVDLRIGVQGKQSTVTITGEPAAVVGVLAHGLSATELQTVLDAIDVELAGHPVPAPELAQ